MVNPSAGSPGRSAEAKSSLRFAAEVVVAGLAMTALAWISIEATRGSGRVAAVWPANATILAALIVHPPRRWPAFLLAGLVGDIVANLLVGDPAAVATGLSLCNGFEILVVGAGLRLIARPPLDLSKVGHLVAFTGLAIVASIASAFGGAAVLELTPNPNFWRTLTEWMLADVLGIVIVTPALLALDGPAWAGFLARPVAVRNLALLGMLAAVTVFVCQQPHLEFRYLIFANLMLIAFQSEVAGAALGLLVAGALLVSLPLLGLEPSMTRAVNIHNEAMMVQLFLLASAMIAFPVAGAVARRRELAAALETTAHDFQMLADHSTDIIVRIGRDMRFVYVSPSCRQLGYDASQLIGRSAADFIDAGDVEKVSAGYALLMGSKDAQLSKSFQRRVKTATGEWTWMEGSPQLFPGPDGLPGGVVTQLRDISVRKTAEAALTESEARYRLLADHATDIILQTDADGVVRYMSPACRRLGYEPEEIIGRPAIDFIHPDDKPMTTERLRELMSGAERPESERREYRILPKHGGAPVWLEGASSVIRDDDGQIIGAISHLRDVTERRAFEDELRRKQAEAEAATVAKSEFLANMSHEIRTPLTGIMGFAGLLEDVGGLPSDAQTYAARIATASRTLLAVVNDILDFSKIEAGQVELDAQAFDPGAFVVETVELVSAQAQEKQLTFSTRLEGLLPAAVSADAGRLRQVLLNLLTNAVKFTEAGEVTVSVRYASGQLKVHVADTGVGIAPDRIDRLFQRFSQADGSINRQYGGTGLGLAICKSLTNVMGGDIGVTSQPGQGSSFWFTIAAPTCAAAAAAIPDDATPEARPARILVVDDSPVNRELVGVLLSVFGHALTEAGGGVEAVEAATSEAFDLILMDLQMPGMDGLTAAREIRQLCPLNRATPIVALSANILPVHLEACREAGMDDHIGKPIDTRELLTKVARWTSREPTEALAPVGARQNA